ncbi:sugar phosphate isomerase/epimerase family protein [Motilibacter aurantiacus]|uniref:sugar phosphate isomerase/epimerase family protein n=1 Tax=Motilibacter aurantiacus TaxID=2714955 RepID=UPI00140E5482|nr:sugar phosphate isomerase/epimerase [Motilibacter aurantiacus]NHC46287.1 sugar phosphate isomerase/epimerase [Motilibacter aurantiacus]
MCYGYDGNAALCQSLEHRGLNRRSFLRGALGATVAAGIGGAALAGARPAEAAIPRVGSTKVVNHRISIQLYTLRSVMTNATTATNVLEQLEEIGYRNVELAGLYGMTPAQMRDLLDDLGIKASSSHDGISANLTQAAQKFANAKILGQEYSNVPYLASTRADDWRRWADQMNAEAAIAKQNRIRYGYHNHAHEFTTDLGGGLTPWDIFMDRLDPKLVHLQVDLYWVVTAGFNLGVSDPVQFAIDVIEDSPLRTRQFHVKDRHGANPTTPGQQPGDMADLGTGIIDFARIFQAHKAEQYVVENDTPDVTPLQTAEIGYNYLRGIRY